MRYFVFYDKNGSFLGGLTKKTKPVKKGYREVSAEDYKRIMSENGITVTIPSGVKEEPGVAEETEETAEEVNS